MRRQHWARYLLTHGAQAGGLSCTEGKADTRGGMQPLWESWHGGKGTWPCGKGMLPHSQAQLHDSSVALLRAGDSGPQAQEDEASPTVPGLSLHRQDAHLPSLQNGSHLGLSSVREWSTPHCQHRPARAQSWVWSNNNNKNAVKKTKHDFKWDGPSLVGVSLQQAAWPSRWQPISWGMGLCKEIPVHVGAPPSSPKSFMGTCWTQKQQQLIMVSTTEKLVATATTSSTAALGYSPPFPGFSSGGG